MISLFAASAASSLVSAIWQGILLAAIVALCLRLLPTISAAARSFIWTAVFLVALALHFSPSHSAAGSQPMTLYVAPAWSLILAGLWLLLSSIRAIQLILSARALRRIAQDATPVAIPFSDAHAPRRYLLCISPDLDRPSVIGFFRPRILLPPALFAALTPAELHHVLLHETEHLRRRDDWINLLQKLALVVFPLNPALLWIERRLCLERELACDDRVLRVTGAPKAYATCLTSLAGHTLLHRGISLALGILGVVRPSSQSELSRRVLRILHSPQPSLSVRASATVTAALLVAIGAGALKLAHTPQFISFVPLQDSASTQTAQAGVPSVAHPQLTSFRTHAAPVHATFLNTSFRVTPANSRKPRTSRRTHRTKAPIHRAVFVPPFQTAQADLPIGSASPRLTLTRAAITQVHFTYLPAVAIATPDGWLIIQL